MKHLIKLNLTKKKAKLKSYFSKPSSAIIMTALIILMLLSIASMFFKKTDPMIGEDGSIFINFVSLFLNIILVFAIILPNKRSLFFEEDSYYLFIGPYTNRQLLKYACFDLALQSLFYGIFTMLFVYIVGGSTVAVSISYYLLLAVLSSVIVYLSSIIIQWIYLKDLISGFKSKLKTIFLIALILSVVAVLVISFLRNNGDIQSSLKNFILGSEFYYVPIFGWLKLSVDAYFTQTYLLIFAPIVGMLILSLIISYYFVNTKGYFFEQAMIDAVDFTEYYKQTMSGKQVEKNKKLGKAEVKFGKYSKAILSKNWLIFR